MQVKAKFDYFLLEFKEHSEINVIVLWLNIATTYYDKVLARNCLIFGLSLVASELNPCRLRTVHALQPLN